MTMSRQTVRQIVTAVLLIALYFALLQLPAQAHAACNGADHTHRVWDIRHARTYVESWDFISTRGAPAAALAPGHYQNRYRNNRTGRYYWSPVC
jgi:hypothetical protein